MFYSIQGVQGSQGEPGPAFPSQCHIRLGTTQSVPTASWTTVEFDTEVYDNNSEFANYKFTAKAAGYYHVSTQQWVVAPVALSAVEGKIVVAGTTVINGGKENVQSGASPVWHLSGLVYMAVDDDLYLSMYHSRGSNMDLEGGASEKTFISIHRVA